MSVRPVAFVKWVFFMPSSAAFWFISAAKFSSLPLTKMCIRDSSYMAEVLADLRDYAADFSPATRESLLLVGNAGLGKTHAALAIAGEMLRQNYDVIYVSCPDFFGKLEALHFGTDPGLSLIHI